MTNDQQTDGIHMANAKNSGQAMLTALLGQQAQYEIERIRGLRLDPNYDAWVRYHLHLRLCDRADGKINRAWSEAW